MHLGQSEPTLDNPFLFDFRVVTLHQLRKGKHQEICLMMLLISFQSAAMPFMFTIASKRMALLTTMGALLYLDLATPIELQ